jgi:hypothetical protein
MNMRAKLSLLALASAFLAGDSIMASVTDVYIAQNEAGLADGGNCANAKGVMYFNTPAYWVSASPVGAQIGPGTTVHLCGALSSPLKIRASGTSEAPITIQFEAGAKITVASCGSRGCLNIAGLHHIVVDGGVDGMIEATNSGTGLASGDSIGVFARGGTSDSEVRNLTIKTMYVHVGISDTAGANYYGIWFDGNNNAFHDNRISDAMGGIVGETPNSGNNIYRNVIHNVNWGVFLSGGTLVNGITNDALYANEVYDFANWDTAADAYHHDGLFVAGNNNLGTGVSHIDIYNNFIHGTASSCCTTAYIYANDVNHVRIFNNLLVAPTGTYVNNGWLTIGFPRVPDSDNAVFNNTVIGGTSSQGACFSIKSELSFSFENNISANCAYLLWSTASSRFVRFDNNIYRNSVLSGSWRLDNEYYDALAAWRKASMGDANSHALTGSLNLDGNYQPLPGSIVLGAGANLSALSVVALNFDKAGVARPTSGAWDNGAYQFAGVSHRANKPSHFAELRNLLPADVWPK